MRIIALAQILARFTLEPLRRIRTFIFRAAIIVVLAITLVAVFAYFFPQPFLCIDSGKVSADALVVLGGGLQERPERAAELFRQHAAPRIILTGAGDDEIHRNLLLELGIPARAIQVENRSLTTRENALYTIKLLRAEHLHRVILVTSWYHSRRALRTFQHYAPDIHFYSRPSYYNYPGGEWKKKEMIRHVRLELLKIPGYWLRYGVNPF